MTGCRWKMSQLTHSSGILFSASRRTCQHGRSPPWGAEHWILPLALGREALRLGSATGAIMLGCATCWRWSRAGAGGTMNGTCGAGTGWRTGISCSTAGSVASGWAVACLAAYSRASASHRRSNRFSRKANPATTKSGAPKRSMTIPRKTKKSTKSGMSHPHPVKRIVLGHKPSVRPTQHSISEKQCIRCRCRSKSGESPICAWGDLPIGAEGTTMVAHVRTTLP